MAKKAPPVKAVAKAGAANLPTLTSASDGAIMQSASRYVRHAVLTAFDNIGGTRRLTEVADEDPKWFFEKIFSKLIAREPEEKQADGVEDLLDIIDAESQEVIDVDAESV